ncbi:MAG: nicotinate (nicotinamide) nucleotide adenylyltransferase [Clostridia bacterium]|nr:nicotinate (nicotinamide) nucleotide adenylyltransferase [Clostridia bacterium]
MKIGLFGGTFDPPHIGHVALSEGCAAALGLDRVLWMPTAVPPHKIKSDMADAAHRLAMCEAIAASHPLITVSDWEIRQGGASFTVDTLTHLTAEHPHDEWYLLTGADMFRTLGTWRRFPDIAKMAVLCGIARDDSSSDDLMPVAASLASAGGGHAVVLPVEAPTVSSTAIRDAIAGGGEWRSLVPPEVAAYIDKHHLYTGDTSVPSADEQYTEILRRRLSPYRFEHSLAVAEEAKRLALLWGADPQKAYTAGLLHDILKDASREEQQQIARTFDVTFDAVEQGAPKLWHARLAPVFLENILGVTDPEILGAVRYHTTAKAGMSLLETLIFLADFTAAGRSYPDVDVMRRLVDTSLDEALRYSLTYTVNDLTAKGADVHPDTAAALAEVNRKGDLPHGK